MTTTVGTNQPLKTCEVCGETSYGGKLHNPVIHRLHDRIVKLEEVAKATTVPSVYVGPWSDH
jgi:hypothetical protein